MSKLNKAVLTALLSTCVLMAGCERTTEEKAEDTRRVEAFNKASLEKPELIGTLPDGRAVNRAAIQKEGEYDLHYVYFVDNATVSLNHSIPNGKSTINRTLVSLPTDPTAEEIIAAAERIKKEQVDLDEAEFERLKQKLGR